MGIPALNITAQTTLGAKLVLSSAYFDASAAEIIGAEGHKLQTIIAAYSAGSLSIDALTTVNSQISTMMSALSTLETSIMRKIAAGTSIYSSGL
ncbi:hypothetical protein [Sinanaerobacter sp. ZZT-01]|uniref:hypothetical protein n=1 Tax=Sinanaerobacter sp. ZZT-01 TaxID=3111540 RepID=UPI002D7738EA|nr:hypothetical protein [Sinanaerobacter sp. ZZT-01]WRR93008.1 hypothetical protein U5921_13345 [Sinanaerobacter sp. ZZT-01]